MRVRSPDDATSRINTNCMPGAFRAVGTLGDREAPDLKLTKVQGPRAQGPKAEPVWPRVWCDLN